MMTFKEIEAEWAKYARAGNILYRSAERCQERREYFSSDVYLAWDVTFPRPPQGEPYSETGVRVRCTLVDERSVTSDYNGNFPAEVVRRVVEIEGEIRRFQSGEGPWPESRCPEKKDAPWKLDVVGSPL